MDYISSLVAILAASICRSKQGLHMTQIPQPGSDEQKAHVKDYFARTAESYVASFSHRAGDDLERLVELGEWNPQLHALDIAIGAGHTALALPPHVPQLLVTDLTARRPE